MYSDNAAGRLHELITSFRRNAGQHSVPQAWASVLGVQDVTSPDLLRRLAYVFRLPDEIQHEIAMVDNEEYDGDLAMRWRKTIPMRLGPALLAGGQSVQVSTAMDEAALGSLEYCSYVLHRHRPQRVFTIGELDRIRELISELVAEVKNDAEMGASLRDFLLSHAFAMSQALDDLGLRGPAALENAFDQAVAAPFRRTDLTVRMEEHSGAWAKYQDLIVGVAAVLQIVNLAFIVPGQVRQELEGPPPAQAPVVRVIQVTPSEPEAVVPNGHQRRGDNLTEGQGSH